MTTGTLCLIEKGGSLALVTLYIAVEVMRTRARFTAVEVTVRESAESVFDGTDRFRRLWPSETLEMHPGPPYFL